LAERLAEHVHDLWAEARLAEGWTYGPRRDDEARTHPGLVPYADLTEQEKGYDRRTALGTLRAILALGYELRPPLTGR
jgi:ryanodine receptor 2